jgi:uncharacterized membrane protein YkvA (DUF1232 family)
MAPMPVTNDEAWSRVERMAADVAPEDERRVHEQLDGKVRDAQRRGASGSLIDNVKTLYAMLRDPAFRIPGKAKAILLAGLLYFIMPVDMIPDVIPGLGFVDDALVIGLVLAATRETLATYRRFRGQA